MKKAWLLSLVGLACLAGVACRGAEPRAPTPVASAPAEPVTSAKAPEPPRPLRLATTTSVEQTGLLADLLPVFEAKAGVKVQVLAVGTGQALKLAERGDVDAVLVHDPEAEERFVADGFGIERRALMHNDFVLVGTAEDPAGLRGGRDAVAALQAVAAKQAPFVSRGDQSGTHRAELRLWKAAGVTPVAPWYVEAGQGQAQTLVIASERKAYALTDRATFRTLKDKGALELLVEGDPRLLNRYSGILVNPAKQPAVNATAAKAFLDWLVSPEAQARIRAFQKDGQPLFVPDAR
jgi:tungstate transport system substrate-binding protein